MTETKQTGAALAAEEIERAIESCRNKFLGGNRAVRFPNSEWLTTVIIKHCPEDEGVAGLLDSLQEISDFPARYGGIFTVEAGKAAINALAETARTALYVYEELKK